MENHTYMNIALSLARSTVGQTSPNPHVAAVIVKDGQLLGTGVHIKAGTPHAEVHAINHAKGATENATMYVTLEPCSHQGKTGPCTTKIIETGIKKVYIAMLDPNPLVAGKGVAKLREAGIEVVVGLGETEAKKLNEKYIHFMKTNTPFITIKAGISLDGKIATKTGDSKWITSIQSRQDAHQLRHEHDGILVGINTILQDNPLLTTRRPLGGRNPIRIILDTNLTIPLSAKVIQDKSSKTIIFTGKNISNDKKRAVEKLGVTVISQTEEKLCLQSVLHHLGTLHIMSVLVEGGAQIHASFIEANAFQQIIAYVAPKVIGGKEAISFIGGNGTNDVISGRTLHFTEIKQIGPDIKIIATCNQEEEGVLCLQE